MKKETTAQSQTWRAEIKTWKVGDLRYTDDIKVLTSVSKFFQKDKVQKIGVKDSI